MSAELVTSTDQSRWNRFLTEAEWSVRALNERRWEMLQEDPTTRYHDHGVLAL